METGWRGEESQQLSCVCSHAKQKVSLLKQGGRGIGGEGNAMLPWGGPAWPAEKGPACLFPVQTLKMFYVPWRDGASLSFWHKLFMFLHLSSE